MFHNSLVYTTIVQLYLLYNVYWCIHIYHQNKISESLVHLEIMSTWKQIIQAITHYDGEMGDSVEVVEFNSKKCEILQVTRVITLEVLHRDIHWGIKLKQTQQIKDVVYRYPLTVGQGLLRYMSLNLENDLDIDNMFKVFNQHPCLSGFELFVSLMLIHLSLFLNQITNHTSQHILKHPNNQFTNNINQNLISMTPKVKSMNGMPTLRPA